MRDGLVGITVCDMDRDGDLLEGDSSSLVLDVVNHAGLVTGVGSDGIDLSGHVVHEA